MRDGFEEQFLLREGDVDALQKCRELLLFSTNQTKRLKKWIRICSLDLNQAMVVWANRVKCRGRREPLEEQNTHWALRGVEWTKDGSESRSYVGFDDTIWATGFSRGLPVGFSRGSSPASRVKFQTNRKNRHGNRNKRLLHCKRPGNETTKDSHGGDLLHLFSWAFDSWARHEKWEQEL